MEATEEAIDRELALDLPLWADCVVTPYPDPYVCGTQWCIRFHETREFVEYHGFLPSFKSRYNGFSIGVWVRTQQTLKRHRLLNGPKVLARIEALDTLPKWHWTNIRRLTWIHKYGILRRFIQMNLRMPTSREQYDGVHIGQWVAQQLRMMSYGLMPKAQVLRFNEAVALLPV